MSSIRALVPCLSALCASLSLACAAGSGAEELPVSVGATTDCRTCHTAQAEATRRSQVHAGGESCLSCHDSHAGEAPGAGPAGLRARCEDCHPAELSEFALPFHHPLEGGLSCTSCHPPHGLAARPLREHLRFESCVECHREYAGPFQFEHEGDRNLLCLSCHLPHGSPNRRLLTHAETRMLCMSCHINLEQTHLQNPGSLYRGCLNCHTEVHGSNWDRELFR